jgi:hypothetical protein
MTYILFKCELRNKDFTARPKKPRNKDIHFQPSKRSVVRRGIVNTRMSTWKFRSAWAFQPIFDGQTTTERTMCWQSSSWTTSGAQVVWLTIWANIWMETITAGTKTCSDCIIIPNIRRPLVRTVDMSLPTPTSHVSVVKVSAPTFLVETFLWKEFCGDWSLYYPTPLWLEVCKVSDKIRLNLKPGISVGRPSPGFQHTVKSKTLNLPYK